MYVNASCRRSARCLDVLSFLPFGIMRSYPGFCRSKQLEYNPGLTHRCRAGHPRANRRTSDRPSFCGVRPSCSRVIMSCHIFQSTHPLRGATRFAPAMLAVQRISIHAPLAGCDPSGRCAARHSAISIHAPLAGCDKRGPDLGGVDAISIHAPLAGCDYRKPSDLSVKRYFNPRTPCGVRPSIWISAWRTSTFQSTHPLRGATVNLLRLAGVLLFQSTHPLRGATYGLLGCFILGLFQSTHPLRGATPRR